MKPTPFGQQVRKFRIDLSMRLKEMAEELGVHPSYLSAMETGRKDLTDGFVNKTVGFFKSKGIDASVLYDLATESKKKYVFDLSDCDEDSRMLVASFARRFHDFTDTQINELNKIIHNNNKNEDTECTGVEGEKYVD